MNPKFDFTRKKFHSLLATSTFSMAIEVVVLLSDTIVVGNLVGKDGISGINLVSPIFAIVAFLGMLISMGTIYRYTAEAGQFHKDRADQFFGQGFILAAVFGIVMFLIVFFGESFYFDFMGASEGGQVLAHARDYYRYFRFTVLLYPMYTFLVEMVYGDGDEAICNASYIAQIGGNIILSIFLCMKMGAAGASLGTLIGTILSLIIVSLHFLKKKNSLHFVWHLSLKDFKEVCTYSIVDAGLYLFWGVLSMAMDKLVIARFGEEYLPVLSVVISLVEMTMIFDGVASAVIPLFNQYKGEDNKRGIKRLIRMASRTSIIEGIIFTVFLEAGAVLFPLMFGIHDPKYMEMCVTAVRLYAPTATLTALLFLYTSYYLMWDHVLPAFLVVALKDLVFPIALAFCFAHIFGSIQGIWIAFLLSPVLALLLGSLIAIKLYGRDMFPFLVEKDLPPTYIYSIHVNKEETMALRDRVEADLIKEGVGRKSIGRIMLFVEDGYAMIEEHNKKPVISELSLLLREDVQVVIKDTGEVFDMTQLAEAGEASELKDKVQNKVVKSIISGTPGNQYLLTSSFNRHILHFDRT